MAPENDDDSSNSGTLNNRLRTGKVLQKDTMGREQSMAVTIHDPSSRYLFSVNDSNGIGGLLQIKTWQKTAGRA
jgi:hypothetical protein